MVNATHPAATRTMASTEEKRAVIRTTAEYSVEKAMSVVVTVSATKTAPAQRAVAIGRKRSPSDLPAGRCSITLESDRAGREKSLIAPCSATTNQAVIAAKAMKTKK